MSDVGVGDLLVRMVISLAVVLGLVFAAYAVLRRRQGRTFGAAPKSRSRSPRFGGSRGGATGSPRNGLRVVGRVGVSRSASVVAVQFADRVFMIGASEQGAPTVLAELELDRWTEATAPPADQPGSTRTSDRTAGSGSAATDARRPNLLEALREATTRRG
jgi:flagellar biogenesis protein FliO